MKKDTFLKELNEISNFHERVDYASSIFPILGEGSSRIAFDMGDGIVLKLASNKHGICQNMVEAKANWNSYECVAGVFSCAEDYSWLLMELCREATQENFKEAMGAKDIPLDGLRLFQAIVQVMLHFARHTDTLGDEAKVLLEYAELKEREEKPEDFKFLEFLESIQLLAATEMPDEKTILDLSWEGNWGLAKRYRGWTPVILDYGLSGSARSMDEAAYYASRFN